MIRTLFLSESVAYKFLLEADEEDTDASAEDPASTDAPADSADTSSDVVNSDEAAAAAEGTPPEESTDTEPVPAEDPASTDAPLPPKKKPSRFAITVEDTKENRLFLYNKFEQLVEEYDSIKNFIETLNAKVFTDEKRKTILGKIKDKVDLNISLLQSFTDDNLYITLDISDIFGIYKIYFSDIRNINLTLRALVRSTEEDEPPKKARRSKSK